MNMATKTQIKGFVKLKLSTDPVWALRALIKIYEFQTQDEQKRGNTVYYNGVGFSGTDGRILSSIAKQYLKTNVLSEKQMDIVFKKIPKYWIQVIKISNMARLEALVDTQH